MITITLELAENGVIKTIIDDNINGAGEVFEAKKVYELDKDNEKGYKNTIKFLDDLMDDLGMDTGNIHSKFSLTVGLDWGSSYVPSTDEVKTKINNLKNNIKVLEKTYLK